ncbi:MH2 domain containing protein, partial [Asbolus verrucosus]
MRSIDNCYATQHDEVCLNPNHYVMKGAPVTQGLAVFNSPWASIAYYELDHKVGETFLCNNESIHVDGYNCPDMPKPPHRFCLGELPNPGRSFIVENYRKQIGGGLRLFYLKNRVYLRCMSDSAIFVQSMFYSALHSRDKKKVWMMTSDDFYVMPLCEDDLYVAWLLYAIRKGQEAVHNLAKMCTVRVSFGKVHYPFNDLGNFVKKYAIIMSNKNDIPSISSASISSVSTELFCRLGDEEKLLERMALNFFHQLKRRDQTPSDMNECITIPKMTKQRRKCGPSRVVDGRLWRWGDIKNDTVIYQHLQTKSTNNCFATRLNE